jgi:hypothetical protein
VPAYLFQQYVQMTEAQFGMEFKSLSSMRINNNAPLEWLREQTSLVTKESDARPENMLSGAGKTKRLLPGRMYLMKYNPAGKGELPYYDRFPLIFVMEVGEDYFVGLNLHYLPPFYRAQFMDSMYPFVVNQDREGENMATTLTTKIHPRVDFSFMKKRMALKNFLPMWKKYRYDRVVGSYLYIPPIAWDTVMMLPLQRFRKAGINRVWRDSIIRGRRRR